MRATYRFLKIARHWKQDLHEVAIEEIIKIEGYFEDGARRAKEAGFDAVEIHAAHGYTLASFGVSCE